MLTAVLPLIILAAFLGLVVISTIIRNYWHEAFPTTIPPRDISDVLTRITPTETPFMRAMKAKRK